MPIIFLNSFIQGSSMSLTTEYNVIMVARDGQHQICNETNQKNSRIIQPSFHYNSINVAAIQASPIHTVER